MTAHFRDGEEVRWYWGAGIAHGTVESRFEKRVSRTIKVKRITRNGTPDNPAYLIRQQDDGRMLKRGSEIEPAT